MCGRYTLHQEPDLIEARFDASFSSRERKKYQPRYNIAPSQHVPVIFNDDAGKIRLAHWGLEPAWVRDVKSSGGIINVRMENLRDKRTFKGDLGDRRCLVLADGFFEWQRQKKGAPKIPYYVQLADGKPFALAGIWQENEVCHAAGGRARDAGGIGDGKERKERTFAIITTEPNEVLAPIHNRMPVILSPSQEKAWLAQDEGHDKLLSLLDPHASTGMRAYAVSRLVNDPKNDSRQVLDRA